MQIPGAQQLIDWGKSKIKLTLVFEVVDDPVDSAESRACLKPVNVWFFFNENSYDVPLDPGKFRKTENVTFVPGLTKQTARDIRQFAWVNSGADGAYLYVLAEPAPEWADLYGTRQYKLQVRVGRLYNIAVSIPPVDAGAEKVVADQPNQQPKAKSRGLKL